MRVIQTCSALLFCGLLVAACIEQAPSIIVNHDLAMEDVAGVDVPIDLPGDGPPDPLDGPGEDTVDPLDTVDPVDTVDTIDPVDTVDPEDTVDPVDTVDPEDTVDDIDTVEPKDTSDVGPCADKECGDGACDPDCDETPASCPGDCCDGACGDETCQADDCQETVDSCPGDCCPDACGDGTCQTAACGEVIQTCAADCCLTACGNGNCDGTCNEGWWDGLYTCPLDCASCGNDSCDPGETTVNCEEDCCGTCGDGVCKCTELPGTCPEDCGAFACGNGVCEPGENPFVCLQDCEPYACGNGACEAGEDPVLCPEDCSDSCGNCDCEGSEDYTTCPQDCAFCGDGICTVCNDMETKENCAWDCCDDKNPCTLDLSSFGGQAWDCYHIPNPNGTCDDVFVCTEGDYCSNGACVPGPDPIVCDDLNSCTDDACQEVTGCTHAPVLDGTPCAVGTCQGGVCVCVPDCGEKTCGDDGCGGNCGVCANYETCAEFQCACMEDDLEDDDVCAAGTEVSTSTEYTDRTLCTGGDEDWYVVTVIAGATLTATASFVHALGDVDLYLYAEGDCATSILSSATSGDVETIVRPATGAQALVHIQVRMSKQDEGNVYALDLALTL